MTKTPIIVCGAQGRMGKAVVTLAGQRDDFMVQACVARHETLNFLAPAVLVDFSHHEALPKHAAFALRHKLALLVCTTGHDQKNMGIINEAAQSIPVLYAPNTSIMANLLILFGKAASQIPGTVAHITDIHHHHKKDAPSGTALFIKEAIDGIETTITSIRAANVVGEHRVHFFKENEQLELSHRVGNRMIFAEGALIAAQFLFGKGPGLYTMNDVLGLKLTIDK